MEKQNESTVQPLLLGPTGAGGRGGSADASLD